MRTSMLDGSPSRPRSPVSVRRHHRSTTVLVTGALTLLAVTAGAAVALVDRPKPAAPPAAAAGPATPTTAGPALVTVGPTGGAPAAPVVTATPAGPGAAPVPVLADGTYPAFLRKVDPDHRTMVVDVVQVFEGDAAVQAAIEDGRGRTDAQYLAFYIRNQNSLLRTLRVARDASITFFDTCEGPTATRAVLSELAKRAATLKTYYSLTVLDGTVRRIVEHQTQPAC